MLLLVITFKKPHKCDLDKCTDRILLIPISSQEMIDLTLVEVEVIGKTDATKGIGQSRLAQEDPLIPK